MLLTVEVLATIALWCNAPYRSMYEEQVKTAKIEMNKCREKAVSCVKKIDLSIDVNKDITQCILNATND